MPAWRAVPWVATSLVLHGLVFAAIARSATWRAPSSQPPAWMEATLPLPESPQPPEPPVPTPPTPPEPVRRTHKAERAAPAPKKSSVPESSAPPLTAPVVDGPSSVSVAPGDGARAIGSTSGQGDGAGSAREGERGGTGEAERKLGPAQLSLWLEPAKLDRFALARPAIALLMAVPGYADVLRGSGIRPLLDLARLRVRVMSLAPERLLIAGVHSAGEQALVAAAERVAAMRDRAPEWRGDSELRATSWVDGLDADRALALQGGAFVIAQRSALPQLLGSSAGAQRVAEASQLRERVFVLLSLEDAPRYLPRTEACALQALRVSIAESGDAPRIALTAHYKTASLANAAPACLRNLPPELRESMPTILGWLAQATAHERASSAQLTTGVTSEEIQKLFDELAWALRTARRA